VLTGLNSGGPAAEPIDGENAAETDDNHGEAGRLGNEGRRRSRQRGGVGDAATSTATSRGLGEADGDAGRLRGIDTAVARVSARGEVAENEERLGSVPRNNAGDGGREEATEKVGSVVEGKGRVGTAGGAESDNAEVDILANTGEGTGRHDGGVQVTDRQGRGSIDVASGAAVGQRLTLIVEALRASEGGFRLRTDQKQQGHGDSDQFVTDAHRGIYSEELGGLDQETANFIKQRIPLQVGTDRKARRG
jgi:hypothetical protein